MSPDPLSEIQKTKKQFLFVVTGEYFITGFFWVFSTLGSLVLLGKDDAAQMLFFSMFVLMFSNGIWEILTGWYADKFKRQFSMSAGFMACLIGFILMGIAVHVGGDNSVDPVFSSKALVWNTGISIWSLGPALLSGAQEAWLVDRCNFFSQDPPEDVDATFKKSAALGVLFKSLGTAICFAIFYWRDPHFSEKPDALVFVLPSIIAAGLCAWLFYRSLRLREEYWSHPKYQTNESLYSFLWNGLQDLWGKPFRWFTLGYVGGMSINYVLSTTIWPYLVSIREESSLLNWALVLILAELLGSFLSGHFSKLIDLIKQRRMRIPVASLMYLMPLPFLFFYRQSYREVFLYILIVTASLFRIAHASVFGSLNTIGQLAINSDERRALLLSMSSAISSFLMSGVFFLFFYLSLTGDKDIKTQIERFWVSVPLFFIILLVWGGYRATRPRAEAR